MASVVYVKWHDAHAVAPSWFALDDIVDEPAIVESVGWLVPNTIAGHIVLQPKIVAEKWGGGKIYY